MKKVILIFLMFFSLFSTVNAAIIKQTDSEEIAVSGIVSEDASKEALIAIIGPFDEKLEYKEAAAYIDKLYVNALYANDENEYSFVYRPKVKNKFYAVSVTTNGEQQTASIYLADNGLLNDLMEEINSEVDVKTVFGNPKYKDILITNFDSFSKITNEQQKTCIYNDINAAKGNGYVDFSAFENVYAKATAVQNINNCLNETDAMGIANEYFSIKNISLYDEYKQYSDLEQKRVFKRMLSRNIKSIDDFYRILNESVFLEKIENEDFSTNLTDFIYKNATSLGIDTEEYSLYENGVNSTINRTYYKTLNEFQVAIKETINKLKDNTTQSGSGTNSPSGGSGGGGAYIRPVMQTPSIDDTDENVIFNDINNVIWAKEAILSLAENKIISGKESGKFYPDDFITREEFTKMIVVAFEISSGTKRMNFSDVSEHSWFYGYVLDAYGNDIIRGMSDTEFGVGRQITRQDIAAILYRIAQNNTYVFNERNDNFVDDLQIADYAKESVYSLKAMGIISGFEDNSFRPHNPATRAQAAKMIYEMMEVLK